jgi:hypothetical protein
VRVAAATAGGGQIDILDAQFSGGSMSGEGCVSVLFVAEGPLSGVCSKEWRSMIDRRSL